MSNKTDKDANRQIGHMLRSAREAGGVTQKEMAYAIGISKNHISAIERGLYKASIYMLLGYCDKLGVSPDEILCYSGDSIFPELRDPV